MSFWDCDRFLALDDIECQQPSYVPRPRHRQRAPDRKSRQSLHSAGQDEPQPITPLDVKAGDRVLFGKWSGTEVKVDGEDLLIMKESDILGVIA